MFAICKKNHLFHIISTVRGGEVPPRTGTPSVRIAPWKIKKLEILALPHNTLIFEKIFSLIDIKQT